MKRFSGSQMPPIQPAVPGLPFGVPTGLPSGIPPRPQAPIPNLPNLPSIRRPQLNGSSSEVATNGVNGLDFSLTNAIKGAVNAAANIGKAAVTTPVKALIAVPKAVVQTGVAAASGKNIIKAATSNAVQLAKDTVLAPITTAVNIQKEVVKGASSGFVSPGKTQPGPTSAPSTLTTAAMPSGTAIVNFIKLSAAQQKQVDGLMQLVNSKQPEVLKSAARQKLLAMGIDPATGQPKASATTAPPAPMPTAPVQTPPKPKPQAYIEDAYGPAAPPPMPAPVPMPSAPASAVALTNPSQAMPTGLPAPITSQTPVLPTTAGQTNNSAIISQMQQMTQTPAPAQEAFQPYTQQTFVDPTKVTAPLPDAGLPVVAAQAPSMLSKYLVPGLAVGGGALALLLVGVAVSTRRKRTGAVNGISQKRRRRASKSSRG